MGSVAKIFGKPLHRDPEPSKELVLPFAKIGVEMEIENCILSKGQMAQEFPEWKAHTEEREGSLRNNGMEFSTKGGYVGAELTAAIRNFCTAAKRIGFTDGNPRAAIHLHIDVTDLNQDSDTELLNTMLCYMMFEHVFFGFSGEWRRGCGFCDSWLTSQDEYPAMSELLYAMNTFNIDQLADRDNTFSKYMAVNLKPLYSQGTLEWRHLPTTFDAERIIQWVNLCLCMKRFGKKIDRDPVAYLNRHGPETMFARVFRGYEDIARPFLNYGRMFEAVPDIMALRLLRDKRKGDPWDPPDNPLLEIKRKPPKAEKPKKMPVAIDEVPHVLRTFGTTDFAAIPRALSLSQIIERNQARTALTRAVATTIEDDLSFLDALAEDPS